MTRDGRKQVRDREDGFILVIALVFTSLLAAGSILAVSGTLGAIQNAANQTNDRRAFFEADGSAALCRGELLNRLNVALPAQIATLASINTISTNIYTPNDPARLLSDYAYQASTSFGGPFIKDSTTQAHLNLSYAPPGASISYACTLTVNSRVAPTLTNVIPPVSAPTAIPVSLSSPPVYLLRYTYTITGTATVSTFARQVMTQGAFTVALQNDNFARYALFTNQQTSSGNNVWFTNRTSFSGPVFTNAKFNFANNPGGLFTDTVTSANVNPSTGTKYSPANTALFYNNGSPLDLNANQNGTIDVPIFDSGFVRGQDEISMPAGTSANRHVENALGLAVNSLGNSPLAPNPLGLSTGVYLGTSGGAMTGGIYINSGNNSGSGNPVSISLAGGSTAQYTVTIAGATSTVTVNPATNQTTLLPAGGSATTYTGLPNGMVFVNGQVTSLAGTVQGNTQMTIAATNDVIITNNVVYQNYTGGTTPSAVGFTNLLGVMSWNGNVRIGTTAPNNINIHATVMTPTGEFHVDNYNWGSSRGTATILGGVIENTYGPFGTFGHSATGYGRNFVYDTRMKSGMSPPFFPTIARVIPSVSGQNDRPNWQQTN